MRHFFRAFKEVPPPALAGNVAQFPCKWFKDGERDKKLQCPIRWLLNFYLDHWRKRAVGLYLPAHLPGEFREFLKAARSALRVDDVRAQKSAATIELEIEVTPIRFGLRKKLNATVFPDLVKILRPDAANIAILHLENSVNSLAGIEQLCKRARPVIAALGTKMRDFECFGRAPGWVAPCNIKRRFGRRFLNGILALFSQKL